MTDTKSLHNFRFGNATHVGQKRKANEDYFGNFETPNGYVFLVCDGMGGHVGGARASQLAVNTIKNFLLAQPANDARTVLHDALVAANNAILQYVVQNPELKGMGTTCVAILVRGSEVYYAHVGDSRIYFLTNEKLVRITKDHSFVQALVDLGEITEEEAEKHPRKNEILNALGLVNMKPPTVCQFPVKVSKGDSFLLCSDGLTGMVNDKTIENVLTGTLNIQDKANRLVELANQAGGLDNITVQIVSFYKSDYKKTGIPEEITDRQKKGKTNLLFYIPAGIVLLLMLLFFFRPVLQDDKKQQETRIDTLKKETVAPPREAVKPAPAVHETVGPQNRDNDEAPGTDHGRNGASVNLEPENQQDRPSQGSPVRPSLKKTPDPEPGTAQQEGSKKTSVKTDRDTIKPAPEGKGPDPDNNAILDSIQNEPDTSATYIII